MIEAKDILAMCDRFEPYLIPLDIHILRQRYNGQVYKSTSVVGQEIGLSDETVRTIEIRALDVLLHCLELEANAQPITPMRLAKAFQQPVASLSSEGFTRSVSPAGYTAHRGESVIFAWSLGR